MKPGDRVTVDAVLMDARYGEQHSPCGKVELPDGTAAVVPLSAVHEQHGGGDADVRRPGTDARTTSAHVATGAAATCNAPTATPEAEDGSGAETVDALVRSLRQAAFDFAEEPSTDQDREHAALLTQAATALADAQRRLGERP